MKAVLRLFVVVGLALCAGASVASPGCGGDEASLEGTLWTMTAYDAGGSMQDALSGTSVEATFADGTVSGTGGCNQYNGSYQLNGEKLTVGPLMSTQRACEQDVMDQESAYMAALQSAASYKIDDGNLAVMDASGLTVLEFQASEG